MSLKAYEVLNKGALKDQFASRFRAHLNAVAELENRMASGVKGSAQRELVRQELWLRGIDLARLEREVRSFESGYIDYEAQAEVSISDLQRSAFSAFLLGRFPLLAKAAQCSAVEKGASGIKVALLRTRVQQLGKKLRQPVL